MQSTRATEICGVAALSLVAPGAEFRSDRQGMVRDLAKLGYLVKTTANGAARYWPAHIAR